MPDGSRFCDPDWCYFLETAKLFLWSLHADPPPHARSRFPRSLRNIFYQLRVLIRWMAAHNIRHFTELDTQALDDFFATMANRPSNQPNQKITPGSLRLYALLLITLYRQGQRYPELTIPEPRAATEHVSPKDKLGSWPRTPDEIAIPLLSSALRLIETPAEDVIALYQSAQSAADAALHHGRNRRAARSQALAAVSKFRFSTLPGEDKP